MSNEQSIEQEIQSKGLNAPRLTPEDIVRSEMVKQLVIAFEREGGYVS